MGDVAIKHTQSACSPYIGWYPGFIGNQVGLAEAQFLKNSVSDINSNNITRFMKLNYAYDTPVNIFRIESNSIINNTIESIKAIYSEHYNKSNKCRTQTVINTIIDEIKINKFFYHYKYKRSEESLMYIDNYFDPVIKHFEALKAEEHKK